MVELQTFEEDLKKLFSQQYSNTVAT